MLSIEVQDRQGLVDIILGEDLDAPSISTVTGPCLRVFQQQPEMLVVQVEGIQFIDSRGVRFLMALVEEADGRGHRGKAHVRWLARSLLGAASADTGT